MSLSEKFVAAFFIVFWLVPVVTFFVAWWLIEKILIALGLKERPRPVSRVSSWMLGRLPYPWDPDWPAWL